MVSAQRKTAKPPRPGFPSLLVKKIMHMAGRSSFPLKPPIHIPTDVIFFLLSSFYSKAALPLLLELLSPRGISPGYHTVQRAAGILQKYISPTYSNDCQRLSTKHPARTGTVLSSVQFTNDSQSPGLYLIRESSTIHLYHYIHVLNFLLLSTHLLINTTLYLNSTP